MPTSQSSAPPDALSTAPARPLVLAIETSCDDTACALLDGEGRVLASVVSSQLAAHRPYGGVVPEIASREHLENWPPVSAAALEAAGATWSDLDLVAATRGPGLVGALLVGLSLGKALAWGLGKPFHAVHHLEGHLYSPFLAPPEAATQDSQPAGKPWARRTEEAASPIPERFTGLVVSGGHTSLFAVEGQGVTTLAETRDDALGECFDKVGRRLGLPYPQGPHVDRLAEAGDPSAHPFPVPTCGPDSLDFSYSGLKSQALLAIEKLERQAVDTHLGQAEAEGREPAPEVLDLLAGFREAAVGQILDRLERHAESTPGEPLPLAVSGGAAANRLLRRRLTPWAEERNLPLHLVPLPWSGDNAAMIAHAALLRERRGLRDDPLAAEAASRIPL